MFEVQTTEMRTSVLVNRWRRVRNILDEVDEGIAAIVYYAKCACAKKRKSNKEALDYLEGATFATTRLLPDVLAFDPQRRPAPSFDVGSVIVAAVHQYVVGLSLESERGIIVGAELGLACSEGLFDYDELPSDDQKYLLWVTPHMLRHLVYDLHRVSAQVLSIRGYSPPKV